MSLTCDALAAARAATRAASELLRDARPEAIRTKGNPKDLVTEWDVRSEELIRKTLEEHAPGIGFMGEESNDAPFHPLGPGEWRWIVDPIDGTVNFAHGLPIWSISIALEGPNGIEVGIVHAPRMNWWFEATNGGGAYDGTGAPLRVSAIDALPQAMLATGFPYDRATNPVNNFRQWEHLQRQAGACRRIGSAALDLCFVACGWMEGYWEWHLKAWDIAAGALIVREAGGTVTDTRGNLFDPHGGEVVATNGAIHDVLVAELGRA
ncbi:MAG TPA: inositol monophosphatase family protein [Kofleriaceae bacterium]|jgi:myo-inositol-1(or 4)-monophosphatase